MADSDSDSGNEAGNDFEYDDGTDDESESGGDEESSECEIVGIGIKCKKDSIVVGDVEIKQEEEDEIDIKPEVENVESEDEDQKSNEDLEESLDEEEAKRTVIRKELSTLTFEELEALKQKLGTKMYNEAMFGGGEGTSSKSKKKRKVFKRDNPNRPRELPSKIHVPKVREVIHVKKDVVRRDPRFEDSCGDLDQQIWEKNYEFLKDIQKDEAKELKKSLETETDEERKYKIIKYLQTLKNKERSDAVKDKEIQKRRQQKEDNIKRLKEGKNPFYLKKSTQKYVDLVEKYDELKASGGLEKYLKKKRTKNAKRDKKSLKIAKH